MSTGLVLMSTATSASADEKHYWQGNGKENLPCDGDLHWIWTGDSTTTPVLHVGNVTDTGDQGGQGNGAWHFWTDGDVTPVAGVGGNTYVTYTGDPGKNPILTISHCEEGDDEPGDKTVPIPAAPKVKDPCGPHNIAFEVPGDTDKLDWTLLGNGDLQVKPQPGYKFDDGSKVKTFELPADSNEPCDEDDDEDEIEVVADVDFRDPTCEDTTVGYTTSVKLDQGGPVPAGLVQFAVTGGALEPGSFVEVTATITDDDYEFDNEDTEEKFTYKFKDVPTDCETPSTPPATTPPATTPPPAVVPPVVGGTETAAPEPQPQPGPGEVAGTETSKPKPNKPKGEKPAVVLGTEAAVPTAVDAGLGSLPGAAPAQGSLLGQLLTGAGVALMLAAGWLMTMSRRRAGAREA